MKKRLVGIVLVLMLIFLTTTVASQALPPPGNPASMSERHISAQPQDWIEIDLEDIHCEETWVCSAWSECDELKTRLCQDRKQCGTEVLKPKEVESCTNTKPVIIDDKSFNNIYSLGISIAVLVLFILGIVLFKYVHTPSPKELHHQSNPQLYSYIKNMKHQQFTSESIKYQLLTAGYHEDEIEQAFQTQNKF